MAHQQIVICVWGPGLPISKAFNKSWRHCGGGGGVCCKQRPGSLSCQQLRAGAELWVIELIIRSVRTYLCVCVCSGVSPGPLSFPTKPASAWGPPGVGRLAGADFPQAPAVVPLLGLCLHQGTPSLPTSHFDSEKRA